MVSWFAHFWLLAYAWLVQKLQLYQWETFFKEKKFKVSHCINDGALFLQEHALQVEEPLCRVHVHEGWNDRDLFLQERFRGLEATRGRLVEYAHFQLAHGSRHPCSGHS